MRAYPFLYVTLLLLLATFTLATQQHNSLSLSSPTQTKLSSHVSNIDFQPTEQFNGVTQHLITLNDDDKEVISIDNQSQQSLALLSIADIPIEDDDDADGSEHDDEDHGDFFAFLTLSILIGLFAFAIIYIVLAVKCKKCRESRKARLVDGGYEFQEEANQDHINVTLDAAMAQQEVFQQSTNQDYH